MRQSIGNLLWGFFFILLGICVAGSIMGYWQFSLFFNGWWTLFIIIPSTISLIQNGMNIGNIIALVIGVLLFLGQQDFFNSSLIGDLIFPIILMLIGFNIIFRGRGNKHNPGIKSLSNGDIPDYTVIFGGQELRFPAEIFKGASVTAVFGGVELDLRAALINEDITITTTTIFGGTDIQVPSNVKVIVSSTPIFGGVSNKALAPTATILNPPTIYFNSICIFGGVDIT